MHGNLRSYPPNPDPMSTGANLQLDRPTHEAASTGTATALAPSSGGVRLIGPFSVDVDVVTPWGTATASNAWTSTIRIKHWGGR